MSERRSEFAIFDIAHQFGSDPSRVGCCIRHKPGERRRHAAQRFEGAAEVPTLRGAQARADEPAELQFAVCVVGTDEQRADGVPIDASPGQPASDDELTAFAVRRLDPVTRTQTRRVRRCEMFRHDAVELEIGGRREHGVRGDAGPAAR